MLIKGLLYLAFLLLFHVAAENEEDTNECSKRTRAATYLDTAADLIDKARFNLPLEGSGDCKCPPKPMDCEEVLKCGTNQSGIYQVWPKNRIIFGSIRIFCDMETDGGGWTVIQRRGDFKRPKDFFFQSWHKYKNGFGDLRRDFWLGNDNIYALSNQRKYYLRIDMKDFENNTRYAFYDQFWIDNESQQYKLHVYDYSGDAGDSFARVHSGQMFSTMDRDNDNSTENCAEKHKGAWWYANCYASNLNGLYLQPKLGNFEEGIAWTSWKGSYGSLKEIEMKIRPMEFRTTLLDLNVEPK